MFPHTVELKLYANLLFLKALNDGVPFDRRCIIIRFISATEAEQCLDNTWTYAASCIAV